MKKEHHIKLLCIYIIALIQFGVHAQEDTTLNATITLGRQGSDCRGRGICSFTMANKSAGNVTLALDENNIITLIIKKDNISENDWKLFEVDTLEIGVDSQELYFEMEEGLQLPEALKNELNRPNMLLEIPEGYYPINIDEDIVIITFKLE